MVNFRRVISTIPVFVIGKGYSGIRRGVEKGTFITTLEK